MTTILIADDAPGLRELMLETLALDGYQLLSAADGAEAWEVIQRQPPDLAILDVQMPNMTGLELTRRIRSDNTYVEMKIILLTALAQETDIRAGTEAGADLYITKPFSPLALMLAVERMLGGR